MCQIFDFDHFSVKTQALLLQNCWIELFLIGYAQSSHSVSIPTIVSSLLSSVESAIGQEKVTANKLKKMSEHIWKINEFFQELSKMNLDDFEFAFLRFIVLFNAGMCSQRATFWPEHERFHFGICKRKMRGNSCDSLPCDKIHVTFSSADNMKVDNGQRMKIDRVQEMFIKAFIQHKSLDNADPSTPPNDINRLIKLLLKLNILRSLDADLVEELFFSKLIGMVQINNVIPHILSLGTDCPTDF